MEPYEQRLASSFDLVLREGAALYGGSGSLKATYDRLEDRLAVLGVSHCLIGGYALILHGVRRFTEDLDVLVNESGLVSLRAALIGSGYVTIPGNNCSIRDAETGVRIDFLVSGGYPGDGKPKPVSFPDPASITPPAGRVHVVDLRTLVELKLASGMTAPGRIQDLADVQNLIKANGLGAAFADQLNPWVRGRYLELAAAAHENSSDVLDGQSSRT